MQIVYGGAFNPPTLAHLEVYHFLKRKLPMESFVYLPVSSAYTKRELASNYHRLNMLELMTQDLPDARISDIEMRDVTFRGTYHSLLRLSDDVATEVAFVIGADNIKTLKHWIMSESLLSEFSIIVLGRGGVDVHKIIEDDAFLSRYKNTLKVFNDFDVDVSSTAYREALDASMVHEAVHRYVMRHQLYKNGR